MRQFRLKLSSAFRDETAMGRCHLVCGDVRERGWIGRALNKARGTTAFGPCHLFLSVYALHHFDASIKAEIYRDVYDHLIPGGAFLNADLFSFETPWLRTLVQSQLEEWIVAQFDLAESGQEMYSITDPAIWRELKGRWLHHIEHENCPLPVFSSADSGVDDGICEKRLLLDAGFTFVECTARFGQSGILWAFKREASP